MNGCEISLSSTVLKSSECSKNTASSSYVEAHNLGRGTDNLLLHTVTEKGPGGNYFLLKEAVTRHSC